MDDPRSVNRRDFTVEAVLAMLTGVAITITGCGGEHGPGGPTARASPTPEPTPTTTPEPTATPTPEPTPQPAPTPSPTPTPPDVVGSVSANHGHVAVITGAQLTGGGAIALDIRGSADHPHTVQLTAAEVTAIAGHQRVSKQSSLDLSHRHTVTFN